MNYIECKSAIAAPLHLVPSHEEPAHTFKDVLVDATVCLRSRHVPCGEASRKAGCRKSARPVSSTHRRASGRCSDFASSHGARIQTSCSSSVVRIADIALGWLGSTVAAGDLMRTRAIQKKAPGFIGAFHLFAFFDDSLAARTVIVFLLDDGRLWRPGAAIAIARRRAQRRHRYLEVRCNGCGTHNMVDLTIIRRPRETPMQLEHRMRCKPCSEQRGYPYKRGHLVRLRRSKVTTKDDGEPRYPGDQRDRN